MVGDGALKPGRALFVITQLRQDDVDLHTLPNAYADERTPNR